MFTSGFIVNLRNLDTNHHRGVQTLMTIAEELRTNNQRRKIVFSKDMLSNDNVDQILFSYFRPYWKN